MSDTTPDFVGSLKSYPARSEVIYEILNWDERMLRSIVIEICNRPDGMDILHPAIQACDRVEVKKMANLMRVRTVDDSTREQQKGEKTGDEKENEADKKRSETHDGNVHDSNSRPSKRPRTSSSSYPRSKWAYTPSAAHIAELKETGYTLCPRCLALFRISDNSRSCKYHIGKP